MHFKEFELKKKESLNCILTNLKISSVKNITIVKKRSILKSIFPNNTRLEAFYSSYSFSAEHEEHEGCQLAGGWGVLVLLKRGLSL